MVALILVAHGKLAVEMKASAEMIFGQLPNVSAIEFCKEEGLDSILEKIQQQVEQTEQEAVIFTDIFCGTPYNASCAAYLKMPHKQLEVLSGMSLPLVLEAVSMGQETQAAVVVDALLAASTDVVKRFEQAMVEEEEEL